MKSIFGTFLVIFAIVAGCFSFSSCGTTKWIWCTSSGIMTYNRHTGQFEMLWENEIKQPILVHDTVYVEKVQNSK